MNIAIDTSPLVTGHSYRGIGTYTKLLIRALKELGSINVIESQTPYQTNADVVHYPFFDLFFLTLPLIKTKPTVTTIHDVIPLVLADQYSPGIRGKIKFLIQKYNLKGVDEIVTDSDTSSNDVVRHLNQPRRKVKTVYLAPDPLYRPTSKETVNFVKDKYSLNKPYFLYVGDINCNKNLLGLFTAFDNFSDEYELVVVSKAMQRNNPAAASLWKEFDRLNINHKVKFLGASFIDNQDLLGIYSGAYYYIQPSFYEGFGLPVLEAQACGCPVISTNGGSLSEVLGSSAFMCNPSELDWALSQSYEIDRDALISAGFENVKRFSWQTTANTMKKVYELAMK